MTDDDKLPDHEVWQPDGHLSDVALTALADGEVSLLTARAERHVSSCDACSTRLCDLAMLSAKLSESLAAQSRESARAEQPMPVVALLIALGVALLGALPTLLAAPAWLAGLPSTMMRTAAIALRLATSMVKVASSGSSSMLLVWALSSVVLVALGYFVARVAPRQIAWKGAEK